MLPNATSVNYCAIYNGNAYLNWDKIGS